VRPGCQAVRLPHSQDRSLAFESSVNPSGPVTSPLLSSHCRYHHGKLGLYTGERLESQRTQLSFSGWLWVRCLSTLVSSSAGRKWAHTPCVIRWVDASCLSRLCRWFFPRLLWCCPYEGQGESVLHIGRRDVVRMAEGKQEEDSYLSLQGSCPSETTQCVLSWDPKDLFCLHTDNTGSPSTVLLCDWSVKEQRRKRWQDIWFMCVARCMSLCMCK
jgi:hypothetical protein